MAMLTWIRPDWPAPSGVQAAFTLRPGGFSEGPYAGCNPAAHVGDDPAAVAANRELLRAGLKLPGEPQWLEQVHGARVLRLPAPRARCRADAAWTEHPGVVCVVLVADCLPVLFCDRAGTRVAAAHAGWRGLAAGVLERTVAALGAEPGELLAWLGPAIGPARFEVGDDVRAAFVDGDPTDAAFFAPNPRGRWRADLHGLARARLKRAGVDSIWGGTDDTFSDPWRYFSYRRDGTTGRMAALVWLRPE
jgi:YfiH family protein